MSEDAYAADDAPGLPDFLRDPLGMLRRRWLWMGAGLLAGLLATAGLLASAQPTYLATATILISSQRIPEDLVRATVEEDSLQQINAMVGQVLTRTTLADLVTRFDLYPKLRASTTLEDVVTRFRKKIAVTPDPGIARTRNANAQLIRVSFEHTDPETAAKIANEVAGLFTAENVRRRSQQARLTTDFLKRQLKEAEEALREQDSRITELKERYRGELPSELNANLGRLERLQQQRQSLALQIAEASNRITLLAQGQNPDASPDAKLAALKAELQRQEATHTDRHPDVIALREQIAALEAAPPDTTPAPASGENRVLVSTEKTTLAQLKRQLADTERELKDLDARVARTPKREEELSALEERESVLRDNYLDFLRKVKEAELAESLEAAQHGERFSILDRAVPPTQPTRSRVKYLLAGIVASLGLAVGVGILLEVTDPVLFAVGQMERVADLPVLGSVPHIS
jgi:succinoglycan biosynthesis transport protein ExoP